MNEIWKPFPDDRLSSEYEVSNLGQVRSVDRVIEQSNGAKRLFRGVLLKQVTDQHGYLRVTPKTRSPRTSVNVLVSRAVAFAFCEKPPGCDVVNHIDGVKTNNVWTNLEWTTAQGNALHAFRTGLCLPGAGSRHSQSKLTESDVEEIIRRLCQKESQSSIADDFPVGVTTIGQINTGAQWSHVKVEGCAGYPYYDRYPHRGRRKPRNL
ncbi:NUMOD4 domain-containing protein [Halomonas sp. BN3-1]|uniref:NUMOD4 domain-containing protein n=1 Tax=Halomonas sp. BN3-1 TaxID=2082393 RepID=UPI000D3C60D9|nr:NUMOD4 domain-containing protein [Halomonas sp. BN3-1]